MFVNSSLNTLAVSRPLNDGPLKVPSFWGTFLDPSNLLNTGPSLENGRDYNTLVSLLFEKKPRSSTPIPSLRYPGRRAIQYYLSNHLKHLIKISIETTEKTRR